MGQDLQKLQLAWRNFSLDRGKARRDLQDEVDTRNEKIAELQDEVRELERNFEEEWKNKKVERREELDNAVKAELRSGRSAQSILRELGSNNTVWIYNLASEVKEEPASGVENNQSTHEPVADSSGVLEGVSWVHHDHTGVHRWLLSDDYKYIKRYGAEGSEFEGEWFVCDRNYVFMAGNRQLFDSSSKPEMGKRVAMLEKLLMGTYTGKIKLADNPWIS